MAECFTFGGRELSWATSRTRHQTSFSCCCRLLSSSCRFRSLSILSWGLSRLETKKKKTQSTRHQFEPKALSINLFCMHAANICRSSLWRTILCFAFLLCPVPVCSLSNLAARHPRISKMSTNQTHTQNGKRRIERREGHSLGAPLSIEIPYMFCLVFLTTMTTFCPSMPLSSAVTNPSPARL